MSETRDLAPLSRTRAREQEKEKRKKKEKLDSDRSNNAREQCGKEQRDNQGFITRLSSSSAFWVDVPRVAVFYFLPLKPSLSIPWFKLQLIASQSDAAGSNRRRERLRHVSPHGQISKLTYCFSLLLDSHHASDDHEQIQKYPGYEQTDFASLLSRISFFLYAGSALGPSYHLLTRPCFAPLPAGDHPAILHIDGAEGGASLGGWNNAHANPDPGRQHTEVYSQQTSCNGLSL